MRRRKPKKHAWPEQVSGRHYGLDSDTGEPLAPEYRKHIKRLARRLMRRLGKKDPENAPKKTRYNGYEE